MPQDIDANAPDYQAGLSKEAKKPKPLDMAAKLAAWDEWVASQTELKGNGHAVL
jgi:hypothetical protein